MITGYELYYTSDDPEAELDRWTKEEIKGDTMQHTIKVNRNQFI